MPRTVQVRGVNPKPWRGPKGEACSFCSILTRDGVAHEKCPGSVGKWTCACGTAGHPEGGNPQAGRKRRHKEDPTDDVE